MRRDAWSAVLGAVLAAALGLGGCSGTKPAATITVRNDSLQAIEVRYAVMGADGNPAGGGAEAIRLMAVGAGVATSETIDDPTNVFGKAGRGAVVLRVAVVPADGGPETLQVLDLKMPPPFVVRVSPAGGGLRVQRVEERGADDRQYRELTTQPPPQPGRGGRP